MTSTIYVVFSLLGFVSTRTSILYNSSDFEHGFDNWNKNAAGKTPEYNIHGGVLNGDCANNFVEMDTSYIYSPVINIPEPSTITIIVTFNMTKCTDLKERKEAIEAADGFASKTSEDELQRCTELIPLAYVIVDQEMDLYLEPPIDEQPMNLVQVDEDIGFTPIENLSPKAYNVWGSREVELANVMGNLIFRIEDEGACFMLKTFEVTQNYCTQKILNFMNFPQTHSMKAISDVAGECVGNSSVVPGSSKSLMCTKEGNWREGGEILGCRCLPGFEPDATKSACIVCPVGSYKSSDGNDLCSTCPDNSGNQIEGSRHCDCEAGFSRGKSNDFSQSCIKELLYPPMNIKSYTVDEFAYLSWDQVDNPNNASFDPVTYYIKCNPHGAYVPASQRETFVTIETSTVISNLLPSERYTCELSASNRVTLRFSPQTSSSVTFETIQPVVIRKLKRLEDSPNILSWSAPAEFAYPPGYSIVGYTVNPRNLRGQALPFTAFTTNTSLDLDAAFPKLDHRHNTTFLVGVRHSIDGILINSSKLTSELDTDPHQDSSPELWQLLPIPYVAAAATGTLFLLLIVLAFALVIILHHKHSRRGSGRNIEGGDLYPMLPESMTSPGLGGLPYDPLNDNHYEEIHDFLEACGSPQDYTVDPRDLAHGILIGQGRFARVYKFLYTRHAHSEGLMAGAVFVAVKEPLEGNEDLEKEAEVLKQIQHRNIVRLIGLTKEPVGLRRRIVMEFLEHGALDRYLPSQKDAFTSPELLVMLLDVARAMLYLHGHNYVHRDLACRNILVGSRQPCKLNPSIPSVPTCKLSDFGLCRSCEANTDFYAMKSGGVFPVRWTAPECVESQQSSRAGDVWSFAIVMWEVFTFGERPYWTWTNTDVYKAVGDGYRLPPPTNCPANVYREVMGDCWHGNPDQRLDFDRVVKKLTYFISSDSACIDPLDSSNFNPFNSEAKEMVLRSGNSVEVWLQELKLSQHLDRFTDRGLTKLSQLTDITYSDLRDKFGVELVGHRRKLIQSIEVIRQVIKNTGANSTNNNSTQNGGGTVSSGTATVTPKRPYSSSINSWCSQPSTLSTRADVNDESRI